VGLIFSKEKTKPAFNKQKETQLCCFHKMQNVVEFFLKNHKKKEKRGGEPPLRGRKFFKKKCEGECVCVFLFLFPPPKRGGGNP